MIKFSLFLLVFLTIVLGVHCSSSKDYTKCATSSFLNDLKGAGDLVEADLFNIKESFSYLKFQKPETFPSREMSTYCKKFDGVYKILKLGMSIKLQPERGFIDFTTKFTNIRDELFELALNLIDYLTDWFIRNPEMVLDSAIGNKGVSLTYYFDAFDEFTSGAIKSSDLALKAILIFIKENFRSNEDWSMTKDRLKIIVNVLRKALDVEFLPKSLEVEAFILKIEEFATREQRDTDFEEWCAEIGVQK